MKREKRSVVLFCWLLILFALPGLVFGEGLTWGPEEVLLKAWLPIYRDLQFTATETQGEYVLRLKVENAGRLIGAVVSNGEWHFLLGRYFAAGDSIDWKVTLEPKNKISLLLLSTTDNRLSVSEVRTDPGARQTYLRGQVFDSDKNPLADVTVKTGKVSVTTDAEGRYALPLIMPSFYVIDIQKPGYTYAVREAEVLAGHDGTVAPAYLSRLDSTYTPVGPEGGTATNSTGDVQVVIPAGALTQTINVNLTPFRSDQVLPAPLPPSSIFTHCVSLEPHGTTFQQPVTLRVKNDLGFAPGTLIPNGFLNRDTGVWQHESMGRVTDDGQWIEAGLTHFSCADINGSGYFGPGRNSQAGDKTSPKDDCGGQPGSRIAYRTGELEDWVDIPLVKSGGLGGSIQLNYFNTSAHPVGIVDMTGQFKTYTPGGIGYRLSLEGRYLEGYFQGSQNPYRLAIAVEGKDAAGGDLPTGLYPYEVQVSSYGKITYGSGGVFGWVPEADTGIETREMVPVEQFTFKGELRIHNRGRSPFGAGWGLTEEERLIEDRNSGNLLLMSGSGMSSLYRKSSGGAVNVSLVAGTESPSIGIFADESGAIYYCDTWASKVKKIVGETTTEVARLPYLPNGIFVRDGVVYVAATWRIYRIDPGGQMTELVTNTHDPCGISADPDGTVYYCETVNNRILRKSPGASPVVIAQGLATPEFLFKQGNVIYVTERLGRKIKKLDLSTGVVTTVAQWAKDEFTGQMLQLIAPSGIFVDEDGTIYVSDSGGQKIIRISPDESRYRVLAGTGGKGFSAETVTGDVATFNFPEGIWKQGNEIFVADLFNRKIRKLTLPSPSEPGGDILYTAPPGDYSTLVKKEDGTYERALKDGTRFFYNEWGFLTRKLELNGKALIYTYDDAGKLTAIENSLGVRTTLVYRPDGKLDLIRDGAGRETKLEIDADGNLVRVTRPDGSTLAFAYDDRHLLTQRTDERGYWKRYTYDGNGMVIGTEDAVGVQESLTHAGLANLLSPQPVPGDLDHLEPLPALDRDNRVTDQQGREWLKTTDDQGHVTSSRDPLGRLTSYEIGCDCGAPTRITYPDGSVQRFAYDDKGRTLSRTDALNATTSYTYDPVSSQVTSITDARGNTTTFTYDGMGNLTGVTDPLGNRTTTAYNDLALPVSTTDPLGNTVQTAYDPSGLPIRVTDQQGETTSSTYDAAGNLLSTTDSLGRVTRYTYDAMGRVLSQTDPRGSTTTFTYAPGGDMASLTDASGNRTFFAYDLKGRGIQETDPLGKAKTYAYDEDGNLLSSVNRRGQTIEYVYDQAKRRIRKVTPERTIAYGYNAMDQLTSIGSIHLSYDLGGRLSTYYDSSGSFRFSYDAAGNLTGVTDNSSSQQSRAYAHDALNRVIRITAGGEVFQFTYDAVGRRGTLTYPNGMAASYTYSPRGELRDLEYVKDGQSLSRFQYDYDAVGRRTALTDSYGRHEFAYDEAGQVTAARWQNMGKERFGYDASGNMLFNREHDFTYGVGNRLLSYACDKISFTYDDDGNVTGKITPDGTTQYQWDSENRLIGITKPDGTAIAYQYDELGRRVGKRVGSQQWQWSYLGQGQEIHRENGPSGLRFYTHGSGVDEHLSIGSNYYVADGLGSIRRIVDAGGNVLNQYRYTAFGKMKQVQAAVGNTYTYTGREWDADAGLYYYRARWYDPDVGRFMSEDPIGLKGGINLSIYVKNNPITASDPLGLWSYKGYCRYISGGQIVGAGCLRCEVWTRCRSDKSKEVGEIVAMFGGFTGGFLPFGWTYFNIELERFPFSAYPTLKDLMGSAEIRMLSGAVGPGGSLTYLRLGLGESEGGGVQAGVDASIDVFWGYSRLERSETWCCYAD
jgi:RHS repeat-associated protein